MLAAPHGAHSRQPALTPCFRAPARLHRQRDLALVFASGRRVHGRFMTLVVATAPLNQPFLAAVMARKKDFRRAVARNRAKRRLRELLRLHRHLCPQSIWLILIARPGLCEAPWQDLIADFTACTRRCA